MIPIARPAFGPGEEAAVRRRAHHTPQLHAPQLGSTALPAGDGSRLSSAPRRPQARGADLALDRRPVAHHAGAGAIQRLLRAGQALG
jgi:hypothetical protein